ncbi:hypothetical protein A2165_04365 [Candidatus Curtissbacteria bacterium RBG_13_40_7]|uniref:Uncharacterized protein n=1 Tax=Candidatus Curtissbacteria bacterium RBG_13_40_7 TaxID=1797706 RepID=A0A1F5FYR9_9BACT|nr:MAG: hypothetical protein A2165_04365 [Candidatus Curtissbacteria bacterium RBG_13_40_7]
MKNIYLAVVIIVAIVVFLGALFIFLRIQSSPAPQITTSNEAVEQVQEEEGTEAETGTTEAIPEPPRELDSTPQALP